MKKTIYSLTLLGAVLSVESCGTTNRINTSADIHSVRDNGLILQDMDRNVRPQDDLYSYANGTWLKTEQIPADKSMWGSFQILREKTDNQSLKLLNELLSRKFEKNSEGQKIQDLYATYMDMDKRNADGIQPIKADLAKIDAIQSITDLTHYLELATPEGNNPFYSWYVYADMKSSKDNAVYLGAASLGLGRDYYQKQNADNTKVLTQYQNYLTQLFQIIGQVDAADAAQRVTNFEKEMAQYLLTNEQIRDSNLQYNPKTSEELKTLVKAVDLNSYLKNVGVNTNRAIIGEKEYYANFDTFFNEKNLPTIREYLKATLISNAASALDSRLDEIHFDFYSRTLRGQKEQRPMNKRALQTINGILGEAFGKLYVDQYFPAESKVKMQELINYLKKSYEKHIKDLKWMSPATKVKALEKLNKFNVKVGYPDKWKDYSKLIIVPKSEGGTLYANLNNVSRWDYQQNLEKVGKKVDKTEWGMSPQTVNAYYSPTNNEIVFPAAILQAPYFAPNADPAVNFGGIGAVIGHEISHGFDDSGASFDGDGNLQNWWTDQDKKKFEDATQRLIEQYNAYEPVKGTFVNGAFTLGENIADLGGLSIAYDALQMYLKDKGQVAPINGMTQDQRFFISWATVWRSKATEKALLNQVKTDPHSPGQYRAIGPVINVDPFYKAFDVKPTDKHYKKPENRIRIW